MVYYDDGNSQQWVSAMSGITGLQGTQGASGSTSSLSSTDDTSTNSDFYPVFVAGGGSQTPKIATTKMKFNPSTGDFSTAGNITAYFSDDRLKDRVRNIDEPLKKLSALNGFYFVPNAKAKQLGYNDKLDVGVSAQEVEAVLPQIITNAPIDPEYKAVRYEKLIPLMIEAIKEQDKEVQRLNAKISVLETLLNTKISL